MIQRAVVNNLSFGFLSPLLCVIAPLRLSF
jgi:hypothetical protein